MTSWRVPPWIRSSPRPPRIVGFRPSAPSWSAPLPPTIVLPPTSAPGSRASSRLARPRGLAADATLAAAPTATKATRNSATVPRPMHTPHMVPPIPRPAAVTLRCPKASYELYEDCVRLSETLRCAVKQQTELREAFLHFLIGGQLCRLGHAGIKAS